MTRHVVFGTGQVGRLVVEQLAQGGAEVVAVNRTGRASLSGGEVVAGDATDPAFTTQVTAGAEDDVPGHDRLRFVARVSGKTAVRAVTTRARLAPKTVNCSSTWMPNA